MEPSSNAINIFKEYFGLEPEEAGSTSASLVIPFKALDSETRDLFKQVAKMFNAEPVELYLKVEEIEREYRD